MNPLIVSRGSFDFQIEQFYLDQNYFITRRYLLLLFQVIQGLDLALTLMYKGESALLHLAPRFAYGQTGLKSERLGLISDPEKIYNGPIIGPETWIEASLELHDWAEDPDIETLTLEQRMAIGLVL